MGEKISSKQQLETS
uniref:Uncharacterized protein n=1 Tax=Anguilla anguilla TaxID=7936 RepID=A0A0E9SCT8_ANGAN